MAAVQSFDTRRHPATAVFHVLAVCVAYYGSGRIGLMASLTVEEVVVTPLWPATGVALSCLLWLGLRVWPGILLGSFLVVMSVGSLDASTFVMVVGNTLAPVVSFLMLRCAGFRQELDRVRDGLALVFLGALCGMLISATAACAVMVATGELVPRDIGAVWTAWWVGDAMGVLVFTPLLLLLRRVGRPVPFTHPVEVCVLAVAAVVVALLVTRSTLDLLFLAFPLLIWAALRFELAGSAPCAALVSSTAVWAITAGAGPFGVHSLTEDMIVLQAFNGSVALTALLLAAVVTERRHVRGGIEEACRELSEVVDRLSPGKAPVRRAGDGGEGPGRR